jgi:outer membrane protein insertion porin family
MQGAFFADAGSLWDTGTLAKTINNQCGLGAAANHNEGVCLMDNAGIRTSAGASIIWNSPVGPLRFDYAFPITKETYDNTQQFRFGASTKF